MSAGKVIIDADPAIGYAFRDVDDGLLLAYVLALRTEFDILGICSVHGNASLRRTYRKSLEVASVCGASGIPVCMGASKGGDPSTDSPAAAFLRKSVAGNPGEVTVLAVGPLTNIWQAGLRDPDFYSNVGRVVMMGGTFARGLGIPALSPFEFNFFADPVAAEAVLAAPCRKVVITADLCRQALFTRLELEALWRIGSRVSTYLAYRIEPWLKLNELAPFLPWKGGFVPWDVVAGVYLRREDLFGDVWEKALRLRPGRFGLATGGLETDPAGMNFCSVPMSLDNPGLMAEFLSVLQRYQA